MVPVSKIGPLKKRWLGTKSYVKKFGSTAPLALPTTLGRTRMTMPNQGVSDLCTAFGEAVSTGYKYQVPMNEGYQSAFESKYVGFPILQGADPAQSMDSALVYDSCPSSQCTFTLFDKGQDWLCNYKNYDPKLVTAARPYFPGIPYKVDGPYDVFDNIRSALYQEWSVDKAVVKVFGFWYDDWNFQAANLLNKGHVQTPTGSPVSRHRYNFIDWVTDESGIVYLVAALTQGDGFGDHGHLYMNRDCVNTAFANMAENGLGLYIGKPSAFDLPTTIATFRIILQFLTGR